MFSNLNALGGAEGCWRVESLLQGLCVARPESCRCLQTPRPLPVLTQEELEGGRPLLRVICFRARKRDGHGLRWSPDEKCQQ